MAGFNAASNTMIVMLLALFEVSRILESVLYMDDPRSAFADEYPDQVKAQFIER